MKKRTLKEKIISVNLAHKRSPSIALNHFSTVQRCVHKNVVITYSCATIKILVESIKRALSPKIYLPVAELSFVPSRANFIVFTFSSMKPVRGTTRHLR